MPIFTLPALGGRARVSAKQAIFLLFFTSSFFQIALKAQPGCVLACKDSVKITMFDGCFRQVNGDFVAGQNSCIGPKTVTIYDQNNLPIGDKVYAQHVGKLLKVFVKSDYWGSTCWGSIIPTDLRAPKIMVKDTVISCLVNPDPASLGFPTVLDECSSVSPLTFVDTVTVFDCQTVDFTGAFRPACWTFCKPGADGAIDTTGAPKKIKLVGAKNSMIVPMAKYRTAMKIHLPAPGFLMFDWKMYGASNASSLDALFFTVNDTACYRLSAIDTLTGTYMSPTYAAGTWVSIEVVSNGDAANMTAEIFNFKFVTTAAATIKRCWKATDIWGNSTQKCQYITLNRASTDHIIWPKNRDDQQLPALECGQIVTDALAGTPLIDDDGNPATTADQHPANINSPWCSIAIGKTDVFFQLCGGSYALARTWTAVDDCSSQVVSHTQVIKVLDKKPPVLNASTIGNLVFPTNLADCKADISLPQTTATDDCSPVTTTATWAFGAGFGPFLHVPAGSHAITFSATDACGNTASFSTNILVKDLAEPNMICQQNVVASIGADGTATVFPTNFDNGTWDNCCLNLLKIKRLDIPNQLFLNKITFQPNDVAPTAKQIELRATDCNGNANSCVVNLVVQDKIIPNLTCPANVTVDCQASFGNLTQFGNAVAFDNSSQTTINYNVQQNINGCGIGQIVRTWTATDPSGNVNSCSQKITVENQTPWNGATEINWPQDYSTTDCTGAAALNPANLPPNFNEPSWAITGGCESPTAAFSDQIFQFQGGFCIKILRKWTVIDFCNYQPGGSTGVWTHTQTIGVMDNQPPVFVNPPADLTVGILGNTCSATVLLPQLSLDDCQPNSVLTANSTLGAGFGPFQNVAQGVYLITFKATDGCGNQATLTRNLTVIDKKPPTAVCKNGLAAPLVSTGVPGQATLSLTANFFNQSSSDNCTAASNLIFSFSQNTGNQAVTFNCNDLGNKTIELWVTDAAGNQSVCTTSILVQDNAAACQIAQPLASISGQILTENNLPVALANVTCTNAAAQVSPANGQFLFGNLQTNAAYNLAILKDINDYNGITTFDVNRIDDHIDGTFLLNSPYKLIAADANSDGQITPIDLQQVQALILQTATNFPQNTSWRFVPQSFVFQNPAHPWPFDESISVPNLTTNLTNQNFVGCKIGDVNNTADGQNLTDPHATDDRNLGDSLHLFTAEKTLAVGDNFSVPVTAADLDLFESYQFTLDFDKEKLQFLGLLNTPLDYFGFTKLAEGGINHLWMRPKNGAIPTADEPIFTLLFSAKTAGNLSDLLKITSRFALAAAYKKGVLDENQLPILLHFETPDSIENPPTPTTTIDFEAPTFAGIFPNPTSQTATASFILTEKTTAFLTISDALGRVVFSKNQQFLAGNGSILIDFEEKGVFFYKMVLGENVFSGRILKI